MTEPGHISGCKYSSGFGNPDSDYCTCDQIRARTQRNRGVHNRWAVFSDRELEGFLDWYAVAYSEGLATHYDLMNEIIEEIKKNRKMDVNDYRWFLL
jgi:hypothetical protein